MHRLGLNSRQPLSSSNDLTITATTIMTSSLANFIISQNNLHWANRPFIKHVKPFFRNRNRHIFDIIFKSSFMSMCDLHSFSPSFFFFKKQNTHQCQANWTYRAPLLKPFFFFFFFKQWTAFIHIGLDKWINYLKILSQYAGFIKTCFTSQKNKCKQTWLLRQKNPAGTFSGQQKLRHGNTPLRNARTLVHILFLFSPVRCKFG